MEFGAVMGSSLFAIFACLTVRWSVSINPYSGSEKPPMFGDYEAQRHWMEVTYNLPVKEWYQNSSKNDLEYWGLDYPPLTAYHSWLCGYVANKINPDWVALHSSKGFESPGHKLFMRYTVILMDVLIYIPAVLLFSLCTMKHKTFNEKLYLASAVLMYPGLILIDHGHFQYNNVSLGLALLAVTVIARGHDLWGSFFFVCALNYKQMELYHSVPFFSLLLGKSIKSTSQENRLWKLMKVGLVVFLSFGLCWLPFITDVDSAMQVLHRMFPFGRGLFEDKVSNIWCILDVLVKLKRNIAQGHLVVLSLTSTFIALLPSALDLLINPTIEKFKYSLINCSLVFFLFSYQVHEKSILIPAIAVCLVFHEQPFLSAWFLLISTFSMFPLLIKDQLILPYFALTMMFTMIVVIYFNIFETKPTNLIFKILAVFSMVGAATLNLTALTIPPPSKYPDLYPVLISGYSCGHFLFFLVYFYYLQITCDLPVSEMVKSGTLTKKGRKQRFQRKKKSKKVD